MELDECIDLVGEVVGIAATGLAIGIGAPAPRRAHVMALLHLLTSQKVVRGTGRHRTRVRKVVVLYQVALCGMGDGRGRCPGRVRIAYKPAKPAQAGLLMTACALAAPASTKMRMTTVAVGSIATRHLERGEHDARGYRGHAAHDRT